MFKVVVCAEILPRDFLQTPGNNFLRLAKAKIRKLKKFHREKILSTLKGFDSEIINFQK